MPSSRMLSQEPGAFRLEVLVHIWPHLFDHFRPGTLSQVRLDVRTGKADGNEARV
jgi:hypothetical protein